MLKARGNSLRRGFRKSNPYLLVAVIIIIALVLGVASYIYSSYISNSIAAASVQATEQSAQTEAVEVNNILVNELTSVGRNLQVISGTSAMLTGNVTGVKDELATAEDVTESFTNTYFWISPNGTLLAAENATGSVAPTPGVNYTQRPFFTPAEELGTTYYDSAITSLTGQAEVVVAQPTYNSTAGSSSPVFTGVIGAAVSATNLGDYLKQQLPSNLNDVGLGAVSSDGVVLYTANDSLIGQGVFGTEFQSLLPSDFKTQFDDFLRSSLQGQAGVQTLSFNGTSASFAYQPVYLGTTSTGGEQLFAIVYIVAADTVASSQSQAVGLLRLFVELTLLGIGGAAVIASLVVLDWNRTLNAVVRRRTADLETANKTLAEQAQAQRDLVNIAAHELRTPTQSILASSELLKDALDPSETGTGRAPVQAPAASQSTQISDENMRDLVNATFRNAVRLQKLTQNLLEVARIDSNKLKLDIETFDLNEKVRSVISDNRKVLNVADENEKKDVKIVLKTDESAIPVKADSLKTYQVISNLLRNAVQKSPDDGTITVHTRKDAGFATVEISDEGSGIDPTIQPRLFEKFVTNTGTGLGLFISKSYVEAQGGRIWAGNNDGKPGATFGFTIPLADSGRGASARTGG